MLITVILTKVVELFCVLFFQCFRAHLTVAMTRHGAAVPFPGKGAAGGGAGEEYRVLTCRYSSTLVDSCKIISSAGTATFDSCCLASKAPLRTTLAPPLDFKRFTKIVPSIEAVMK